MLDFRLSFGVKPSAWEWDRRNEQWDNGTSWVSPYRHPLLEQLAVSNGTATFLLVRERTLNHSSTRLPSDKKAIVSNNEYEKLLTEALDWPLDFLLVECLSNCEYRLRSGQWGSAPVYLSTTIKGDLRGSWWLPALRSEMRTNRIDELEVIRILAARHRYTRETLFRGIYQLTERARADFTQESGLDLHYPEAAMHARPRDLKPDVDVIQVYEDELARAVSLWPYNPQETAVELSGGLDSANVAMTLGASNSETMLAYALIYGGEIGTQQISRRQAMIDHLRFTDMQVQALDRPPLHPLGGRAQGDAINPKDETYHEAVEHLLEQARACGIRTVFTGDGGDELVSLRGTEWATLGKIPGRYNPLRNPPSWLTPKAVALIPHVEDNIAPRSVIDEASLLGFASRTPMFMVNGMWPVSPLCSPRLIRFTEQLPVSWRQNKHICRERLRRLGFSDDVVNPPLRENFTHVMEYGLRQYGAALVKETVSDSILVNLGFVDPDKLRASASHVTDGTNTDTTLFAYLRLELGLRGLLG